MSSTSSPTPLSMFRSKRVRGKGSRKSTRQAVALVDCSSAGSGVWRATTLIQSTQAWQQPMQVRPPLRQLQLSSVYQEPRQQQQHHQPQELQQKEPPLQGTTVYHLQQQQPRQQQQQQEVAVDLNHRTLSFTVATPAATAIRTSGGGGAPIRTAGLLGVPMTLATISPLSSWTSYAAAVPISKPSSGPHGSLTLPQLPPPLFSVQFGRHHNSSQAHVRHGCANGPSSVQQTSLLPFGWMMGRLFRCSCGASICPSFGLHRCNCDRRVSSTTTTAGVQTTGSGSGTAAPELAANEAVQIRSTHHTQSHVPVTGSASGAGGGGANQCTTVAMATGVSAGNKTTRNRAGRNCQRSQNVPRSHPKLGETVHGRTPSSNNAHSARTQQARTVITTRSVPWPFFGHRLEQLLVSGGTTFPCVHIRPARLMPDVYYSMVVDLVLHDPAQGHAGALPSARYLPPHNYLTGATWMAQPWKLHFEAIVHAVQMPNSSVSPASPAGSEPVLADGEYTPVVRLFTTRAHTAFPGGHPSDMIEIGLRWYLTDYSFVKASLPGAEQPVVFRARRPPCPGPRQGALLSLPMTATHTPGPDSVNRHLPATTEVGLLRRAVDGTAEANSAATLFSTLDSPITSDTSAISARRHSYLKTRWLLSPHEPQKTDLHSTSTHESGMPSSVRPSNISTLSSVSSSCSTAVFINPARGASSLQSRDEASPQCCASRAKSIITLGGNSNNATSRTNNRPSSVQIRLNSNHGSNNNNIAKSTRTSNDENGDDISGSNIVVSTINNNNNSSGSSNNSNSSTSTDYHSNTSDIDEIDFVNHAKSMNINHRYSSNYHNRSNIDASLINVNHHYRHHLVAGGDGAAEGTSYRHSSHFSSSFSPSSHSSSSSSASSVGSVSSSEDPALVNLFNSFFPQGFFDDDRWHHSAKTSRN